MAWQNGNADKTSLPGSAGVPPASSNQAYMSRLDTGGLSGSSSPIETPWRSRGYLPHFDDGVSAQSLTFRLADSLPGHVVARLERELCDRPPAEAARLRRKQFEAWLDRGVGATWLAEPSVAKVVAEAICYLAGKKYELHAWVVMPNHVHMLITPIENSAIAAIAHSLKSFTAHRANRLLGRTGAFWQREYYDRAIRNGDHLRAEWEYVEANPLKAGLCARIEEWPFSSANAERYSG